MGDETVLKWKGKGTARAQYNNIRQAEGEREEMSMRASIIGATKFFIYGIYPL